MAESDTPPLRPDPTAAAQPPTSAFDPAFPPLPTPPAPVPPEQVAPMADFSVGAAPVPPPAFPPVDQSGQPYPPPGAYYPAATPPPSSFGGYGYGMQPPAPGYPAYVPPPKTNGLAVAAMVVAIVGAVFITCYGVGGLLGSVGAIMGHVARRQLRERHEGGEGMVKAAIIVGWIATGIGALALTAIVLIIIFATTRTNATTGLGAVGAMLAV